MKKSVKQKKARKVWLKPLIKKRTTALFASGCNFADEINCVVPVRLS